MDKYLLEILKESNTIIIPGLGALTITNKDTGEIMFMPYLQHDDGKLAEFIAEKDGIDKADAKNMVAKYVREIKAELDKGEVYSMFQLGEFVKMDDGDVAFTHWSGLKSNQEEEKTETPAAAISEEEIEEEPVQEETNEIQDEPGVEEETNEVDLQFEPLEEEITQEEIVPEVPAEPEAIELSEEETEIKEGIEEALESAPEIEEPEVPTQPEAIELSEEETEIKSVIEEALESAPEVEEIQTPEIPTEPEITELSGEEVEMKNVIEEALESAPEIEEVPPIVEEVETPVPVVETPSIPESHPEPEAIELTKEEEEIKHVIQEALDTPTLDDPYPKETPIESAAIIDGAMKSETAEPQLNEDGEVIEDDDEKKEKAGAGFWITLIVIALLIIAGGAYVGRNYNELKQHIPFLADEKSEKEEKSLKDEMFETINEDRSYTPRNDSPTNDADSDSEPTDTNSDEASNPETPMEPEVNEKPVTVEKQQVTAPNISSSSSGPFKVIAGAFSSEDNANRLAAEFKAKGLKSEVFQKGELYTVSMQSYATSEEANANLAKLQSMAPGAWILYKN